MGERGVNVLKSHLRTTIQTLLANGLSQHEIARHTGVDRKTIRRYERAKSPRVAIGSDGAEGQTPPPRPPARTPKRAASACEGHRAWIEAQVLLGRNAQSIYQDLVDQYAFTHKYNSVKRFVRGLKAREPQRFDVLEFLPGEEAQVDFGHGAPTRTARGKYHRPHLFVMTLKYSGKSFRKVVWKADQESWARLHEEAFRVFGGCPQYAVLDNLRQGVLRPDLYEPALNPVYGALLAHYGVVADPCRVGDPNRKGTVESAIQHTQSTALKGRKFETIEQHNAHLAHWEERWAALRIHGRKKRQVLEMFLEERAHLRALPVQGFRYFKQETRTVDDAGLVQVDSSYYVALPAPLHSQVTVRIYAQEIEVLDEHNAVLRRHARATRKGHFEIPAADRLFNPSRESARLLARVAKIGPHTAQLARELFARLGRPGQRAIYGLANLVRKYSRADIEAVCSELLASRCISYQAVKRALERRCATPATAQPLRHSGAELRALAEYQAFWERHSQSDPPEEEEHDHVYH
jgi:transposase